MRSLTILPASLLACLFPHITFATRDSGLPCASYPKDNATCNEPLDAITTISSNSSYIAKIPCVDCPVVITTGEGENTTHTISHETKNDLFFNISLSHNRTTLLFTSSNEAVPLFPSLIPPDSASREPPHLYVAQIAPNFSRADLDTSIACPEAERCRRYMNKRQCLLMGIRCLRPVLDSVSLDYDFSMTRIDDGDKGMARWEVTLDAIGGQKGYLDHGLWVFNNTAQQMLRVVLGGVEIESDGHTQPDTTIPNDGGSPFGGVVGGTDDDALPVYNLTIQSVSLVPRSYTFPTPQPRSLWSTLTHFFGSYPASPPNHIIYLQSEWGDYGRIGTLRNALGTVIHEWWWDLIGLIIGCSLTGLAVLYALYRLTGVVREQRRLARWGGMDEVWRRMREGGGEDEEGLLDDERGDGAGNGGGMYRDEPITPPPRYTDELPVDKPLPHNPLLDKPLPDKPLPDVPLI
jgi:hypothetical protein